MDLLVGFSQSSPAASPDQVWQSPRSVISITGQGASAPGIQGWRPCGASFAASRRWGRIRERVVTAVGPSAIAAGRLLDFELADWGELAPEESGPESGDPNPKDPQPGSPAVQTMGCGSV